MAKHITSHPEEKTLALGNQGGPEIHEVRGLLGKQQDAICE